ncbi:hypothetical protein JW964_18410 [candidate division KSB1 bacterium]|nr:hypothetical protein [candidate division KSB1 bacterium]
MKTQWLLLFILSGIYFIIPPNIAKAEGYFLSCRQKGQLVWLGRIHGADDYWYNVRLVPGYVEPSRYGFRYLKRTGRDLGEYFGAEKYRNLAEHAGDAYEWAFKESLWKFTIKGTPRAWKKYFIKAHERQQKHVFGWWLGYPWALFQSVVDNTFRIPSGVIGTASGITWGTAFVPGFYMTNSLLKASWHLPVQTILIPVSGYAWNTVVAPPLAIFGQKPTAERADGFWVQRLSDQELRLAQVSHEPLTPKEIHELADWTQFLLNEFQSYMAESKQIDTETAEQIKKIREAAIAKKGHIEAQQTAHLQALLNDSTQQKKIPALQTTHLDSVQIVKQANAIIRQLRRQKSYTHQEIKEIYELIKKYPAPQVIHARKKIEKTDPLKEGIEVIKEID